MCNVCLGFGGVWLRWSLIPCICVFFVHISMNAIICSDCAHIYVCVHVWCALLAGLEYKLGDPPKAVSAGGGTSFLAAMDLFHRCLNRFPLASVAAGAPPRSLVLALLSDGETTADDYRAAKARLLNASLLSTLSAYASVHVLLVGMGASRYATHSLRQVTGMACLHRYQPCCVHASDSYGAPHPCFWLCLAVMLPIVAS
jgi:hypothetical protein